MIEKPEASNAQRWCGGGGGGGDVFVRFLDPGSALQRRMFRKGPLRAQATSWVIWHGHQ